MAAPIEPFTLPDLLDLSNNAKPGMTELFYLIAYCDTYHDFSGGERKRSSGKEEEGETMNISFTGIKYPSFILNNVISTMDPTFDFKSSYTRLNDLKLACKDKSYENTVYRVFTSIHNPVINGLRYSEPIKKHFEKIFNLNQGDTIVSELLSSDFFTAGTAAPIDFSTFQPQVPIYDIKMERILYTPATVQSFVNFIKQLYQDNIDSNDRNTLKFVEDAGSFPREILISHPDAFPQFKKIKTTQSRWDSGGYSGYSSEAGQLSIYDSYTMPAYSFHTLDPHTNYRDHDLLPKFSTSNFIFNPTNYDIILKNISLVTKCGPSVNHLILHILATQLTGAPNLVDVSNRIKAISLIDKQLNDSKKNSTFKFIEYKPSDGNLDTWKAKRQRELTTYKRSGDYENILSALKEGAVLITGDEAAFVFAMLVECPAILHTRPPGLHNFRFYIPPGNPARSAVKKQLTTLQTYLFKANELTKLFAATDTYYAGFITNIQSILATNEPIVVANDTIIGSILRILILANLISQKDLFIQLNTARSSWKTIVESVNISQDTVNSITSKLSEISMLSNSNEELLIQNYSLVEREINTAIATITTLENGRQFLDETLAQAHIHMPRKSYRTKAGKEYANPVLFEPIADGGKDGLFTTQGINFRVRASSILPQYNEITTSIGIISKTIKLIAQASDDKKVNYRFKQLNNLADTFEEYGAPGELVALFRDKTMLPSADAIQGIDAKVVSDLNTMIAELTTPEAPFMILTGGRTPLRVRSTKKVFNNASPNRGRNTNTGRNSTRKQRPTTKSYAEIHTSITRITDITPPFGLTTLQYADLITERLIILDVLSNVLTSISKQLTPLYESSEPISSNSYIQEPSILEKQVGGGSVEDFIEYWSVMYTDTIYPFILKHFNRFDNEGNLRSLEAAIKPDIIASVNAQTFIEDMMLVLETLSLAPEFNIRESIIDIHNTIKTNSQIAINGLFNQYNSILTEDKPLSIIIKNVNNIPACGGLTIAEVITSLNNNMGFTVDDYLPKISCFVGFLNGLFHTVAPSKLNGPNLALSYVDYFQSAYGELDPGKIELFNRVANETNYYAIQEAVAGGKRSSRRRNPRARSNRRKRNSRAV